MSRYIDAENILYSSVMIEEDNGNYRKMWIVEKEGIDAIPTADVRENVRGEWIEKHYTINCSVCKKCLWSGPYIDLVKKFNFCPNCGADMRGEA